MINTKRIRKVYLDKSVAELPEASAFLDRLGIDHTLVDNPQIVYDDITAHTDPVARGKQVLLVTRNRGSFVRECPGTRNYRCCGYKILNIANYCTMDCAYCILQSYFHPPVLQYFVNHNDLWSELDPLLSGSSIHRIGTGEFTDSLIWDGASDLNARLVERFAVQNHAVLELKTKSVYIDPLLSLTHNKKTIIAWSLNTPKIISANERRTAGLQARLAAAARCHARGYPLAFHFDPLIAYPGCEDDYRCTVKEMFAQIPAEAVVWISLGALRFMPSLRSIMAARFPDSSIGSHEFIPGLDGKMRYFKPLRIRLYLAVADAIREYAPNVTLYFCMEDDAVWRQVLGFVPDERGGVAALLDESAIKRCGLVKDSHEKR